MNIPVLQGAWREGSLGGPNKLNEVFIKCKQDCPKQISEKWFAFLRAKDAVETYKERQLWTPVTSKHCL